MEAFVSDKGAVKCRYENLLSRVEWAVERSLCINIIRRPHLGCFK